MILIDIAFYVNYKIGNGTITMHKFLVSILQTTSIIGMVSNTGNYAWMPPRIKKKRERECFEN